MKHTSLSFGSRARLGAALVGFCLFAAGCGSDDAGSGTTAADLGAGGNGGNGGGGSGGGGASGTVTTQFWTGFTMSKPEGANGALGPLFNAALQDRTIMVLLQRDDTGAGGPIVRTGSAKVVAGQDTPDDPTDDVFAFNEASTCSDKDGNDGPCSIEIGEATVADDADGYHTTSKTLVNAYSSRYRMVVRLREMDITVTTAGCDFDSCATFKGAVTVTDASQAIFEVVTGDPTSRTDLKTFMENFGNQPDTMIPNAQGEMEAAWTFEGTFTADEVEFQTE